MLTPSARSLLRVRKAPFSARRAQTRGRVVAKRAKSKARDPILLTPGPLTTTAATKAAMLHDWGSRDANFIAINARVRARLAAIVNGSATHVTVPVQGSGTFAVEAAIGTLVPKKNKALVLVNGAYGKRMCRILDTMGRAYSAYETPEDTPPDPAEVDRRLAADPELSHVLAVHCETTSGILNPVGEIARVVKARGRALLLDSMSAFGAIPLDLTQTPCEAVMASSNKNLEGVPGMGFVVVRHEALAAAKGNAHSLSLDLHDQWQAMEATKQWRFTPPIHVIVALDKALEQFDKAGGVKGRSARYGGNCRSLVQGMRKMGFVTLLPDRLQAPIIVTFHMPKDPKFKFERFYNSLKDQGYIIYPGKLTVADSFRIGCIGAIGKREINGALKAVRRAMKELGVKSGAP
ncbi:MAG: 2-aminoethylphosphonate--pyruvate transaminase [Rhodospirillales bacterium]|nr:2-aminoethylphosphonate--pyruvate transaminase [Rhodospirillales bacterium]MSP79583.1 2-aminoethylphosphonate--pyruvate transaminase [Rhodospirillales bacterium]